LVANVGRVVAQGPAATLFALQFLPKAKPFSVPAAGGTGGTVMLYPGQRLADGSIVIGKLDGIHIYVANGDKVHESIASTFVARTLLLNDISSRIQQSMWLVTVGEAELEFIFVVSATLVGTIGTALAVSEFVCAMVDEYYQHKREVDLVMSHLRSIVRILERVRVTCPVLFDYLLRAFTGTAANAAKRAWQGITPKDMAYFAGKFTAYAIKSGGSFTHGLKEAVVWTAALRSPGIAGRSFATEVDKTAARLRSLGQTAIGREQLLEVAKDSCVLKPEVQAMLKDLSLRLHAMAQNLDFFFEVASPSM